MEDEPAEQGDKWDIVILHSEAQYELAIALRDSIREICSSSDQPIRVETFGDLFELGTFPTTVFDDIAEHSSYIMFIRDKEFFSANVNGFNLAAALEDRIDHLDRKRHWTVIPVDIVKKRKIPGKCTINHLGGLTVSSEGEVQRRDRRKIESMMSKVRKPAKACAGKGGKESRELAVAEDRSRQAKEIAALVHHTTNGTPPALRHPIPGDAEVNTGNNAASGTLPCAPPSVSNRSGQDPVSNGSGQDPVLDRSGQDPVSNRSGQDPVSNRSGQDPVSNRSGQDPMSNGSGQDPLLNRSGQDLVLDRSGQDPVSNGSRQDPVLNRSGQDPVLDRSGQDPVSNMSGQDPVSNRSGQDPVSNRSGQNPVLDRSGQDPVLDRSGQDPVLDRSGQDPVVNRHGQDPVSNRLGQDPVLNRPGQDPVLNGSGQDPMSNRPGQDPVSNRPGQDPVSNRPGQDPMSNRPGQDPVSNKPGQDPVSNRPGQDPVLNGPGQDPVSNRSVQDPVLIGPGQDPVLKRPGQGFPILQDDRTSLSGTARESSSPSQADSSSCPNVSQAECPAERTCASATHSQGAGRLTAVAAPSEPGVTQTDDIVRGERESSSHLPHSVIDDYQSFRSHGLAAQGGTCATQQGRDRCGDQPPQVQQRQRAESASFHHCSPHHTYAHSEQHRLDDAQRRYWNEKGARPKTVPSNFPKPPSPQEQGEGRPPVNLGQELSHVAVETSRVPETVTRQSGRTSQNPRQASEPDDAELQRTVFGLRETSLTPPPSPGPQEDGSNPQTHLQDLPHRSPPEALSEYLLSATWPHLSGDSWSSTRLQLSGSDLSSTSQRRRDVDLRTCQQLPVNNDASGTPQQLPGHSLDSRCHKLQVTARTLSPSLDLAGPRINDSFRARVSNEDSDLPGEDLQLDCSPMQSSYQPDRNQEQSKVRGDSTATSCSTTVTLPSPPPTGQRPELVVTDNAPDDGERRVQGEDDRQQQQRGVAGPAPQRGAEVTLAELGAGSAAGGPQASAPCFRQPASGQATDSGRDSMNPPTRDGMNSPSTGHTSQ